MDKLKKHTITSEEIRTWDLIGLQKGMGITAS